MMIGKAKDTHITRHRFPPHLTSSSRKLLAASGLAKLTNIPLDATTYFNPSCELYDVTETEIDEDI